MSNKINTIAIKEILRYVEASMDHLAKIRQLATMAEKLGLREVEVLGHLQPKKTEFLTRRFAKNFGDLLKTEYFEEIVELSQQEKRGEPAASPSSAPPSRPKKRSSPRKSG